MSCIFHIISDNVSNDQVCVLHCNLLLHTDPLKIFDYSMSALMLTNFHYKS
jgi:hypothetical protein